MAQAKTRRNAALCGFITVVVVTLFAVTCGVFAASEKWSGIDEAVIGKFAKEYGREASLPLINTDHGDMPLFLFLMAGAAGGFLAGYYWRKLIEPGTKDEEKRVKEVAEANREQPRRP